jgi:hypothetical protein
LRWVLATVTFKILSNTIDGTRIQASLLAQVSHLVSPTHSKCFHTARPDGLILMMCALFVL